MARGYCNELGYREKDTAKAIKVKMFAQGVTQSALAEELGITQQALSYKLNSNALTYSDLWLISKNLKFTDNEILSLFK